MRFSTHPRRDTLESEHMNPIVPVHHDRRRRALLAVIVGVWACASITGTVLMWRYKATPGRPGDPPRQWPAASAIVRNPHRATILMLAHPHCPCTGASLEELSRVMQRVGGGADAHVLFLRPHAAPPEWEDSALWRRARELPGVTARWDVDGREAARFGAYVSGQVVAYDEAGRLIYSGGITGARGHQGDNVGRQRLLSALTSHEADQWGAKRGGGTQPVDRHDAEVFGCSLLDPGVTEGGRGDDPGR